MKRKCIEAGLGQLVVTRGDAAFHFEMADHAFDDVALSVDAFVPSDSAHVVRARRNDRTKTVLDQRLADGVAVVSFVRDQIGVAVFGQCSQRVERRGVVRFPACEVEGERP